MDSLGSGFGKLRATRQYVDVIGPGEAGKIQITRQFINALGGADGAILISRQYVEILSDA
ncbi:MAG: hypothetical protein WC315_00030 [Candidatus Omnitrophota bacterium]